MLSDFLGRIQVVGKPVAISLSISCVVWSIAV